MVGPGKVFKKESSQMSGKRYFELVFCKQSHFVHLLNRIYRKCVKYSFVSRDSKKAQK